MLTNLLVKQSLPKFAIILLSAIIVSCNEKDVLDVKSPRQDTAGVSSVTLPVSGNNIYLDSLREASNTVYMLAGMYDEAGFPDVRTGAFFEFIPDSDSIIGSEPELDSLVITLFTDNKIVGDSSQAMEYQLHRLGESFDQYQGFYRSSVIPYNEQEALATHTFVPENNADSVSFRLSESFAQQVLDLDGTGQLQSNEDFLSFLNGFYLRPVSGNAILRFDVRNVNMNLYYHSGGQQRKFTFLVNRNFNHSVSDALQGVNSYQEIPSSVFSDDNTGLLQSSIGAHYKVNFDRFHDFVDSLGDIRIHHASLELSPYTPDNAYARSPEDLGIFAYVLEQDNRIPFAGDDPYQLPLENSASLRSIEGQAASLVDGKFVLGITKHLQASHTGKIANPSLILGSVPSFTNANKISFYKDAQPAVRLYYSREAE